MCIQSLLVRDIIFMFVLKGDSNAYFTVLDLYFRMFDQFQNNNNQIVQIEMTQIIDLVFQSQIQRHPQKLRSSQNLQELSQQQKNETTMKVFQQKQILQKIFIDQQKMQIFANFRQNFNHFAISIFCFVNNKEIRAETQFQKTFLLKKFQSPRFSKFFTPKINPSNGIITLTFSTFTNAINRKRTHQKMSQILQQIFNYKQEIKIFFKEILKVLNWQTQVVKNQNQSDNHQNLNVLAKLSTILNDRQRINYSILKKYNFTSKVPTTEVESMSKFIINSQFQNKIDQLQLRKLLQTVTKVNRQIQQYALLLPNKFKNLQNLSISEKDIRETAFNSQFNQEEIFKVNDKVFGKINVSLQKDKSKKHTKLIQNLRKLNQATDYSFIDYYFQCLNYENPHIAKLALKKTSLANFLQKNANSLSFQIKIKIFMQIFSALKILQQKHGLIMSHLNIQNIEITKNYSVKLSKLWNLIDQQKQFEARSQYEQYELKVQNSIRLYLIFEHIFLNKQCFSIQPRNLTSSRKNGLNFIQRFRSFNNVLQTNNINLHYKGVPNVLNSIMYVLQKNLDIVQLNPQKAKQMVPQQRWKHYSKIKRQIEIGNKDLLLNLLITSNQQIIKSYQMFK